MNCCSRFQRLVKYFICLPVLVLSFECMQAQSSKKDDRMDWWRDARFGLFIHWGLYAIPAGEWNGNTGYGEWIRNNAQIPLSTYDKFVPQFNPIKFNAEEWVKLAKDAGMKYIVITSKHHDGFSIFDSKQTDFDVMSTPFHRDILKELAEACQKQDMRLCFYHSIMDWHHPDYLPRRDWEKDRSAAGADFERYVNYMKSELKELLTNYGKIGVLWFDGEWEATWTHERGKDLYNYVRTLQPSIIINNRVDVGREGMQGLTKEGGFVGDFGTPEQEIPATGIPGADWESCMTMNNNWGYNSHDNNWKSAEDLVQKLIDIASKGGNFLLNIGPTSEGVFPQPSIERLKAIGAWMKKNSESIYGTSASPFKQLSWGRCTQKSIPGGTRLYLHIFNWPANNKLVVPGLGNVLTKAVTLADNTMLTAVSNSGNYVIDIAAVQKQEFATVIALDIKGTPIVYLEPEITASTPVFIDQTTVTFKTTIPGAVIRYTVDGTEPAAASFIASTPIILNNTATVKAACFLGDKADKPVSAAAVATFEKVTPQPAKKVQALKAGLAYSVYEGKWNQLPDFTKLKPVATGTVADFDISSKKGKAEYGFVFDGWINIPADGVYTFYISSDDGSKLMMDNNTIVDNDGLHAMGEKSATIALAKGYHPIKVSFFQNSGGDGLDIQWKSASMEKSAIYSAVLYRKDKP